MEHKLLFTRLDGFVDLATITTRKVRGYYATTIKIGTISRRVNSGMINSLDSYHSAVEVLGHHQDNVVI